MKPRKNIIDLKPYQVVEKAFTLKLDANESYNYLTGNTLSLKDIEYYPDHQVKTLKEALSKHIDIESKYITVGNGSSELLDLLFKAYLEKNDVVLAFDPTFSMYEIYANIYQANYIKVPVNDDFKMDMDQMIKQLSLNPKMIVLCTPNNPTGYQIPRKDILRLLNLTQALVVVDEAYMEFSENDTSMMKDILMHKNIAVLKTFSKAFGLAGARLGYMVGSPDITHVMNKIRSPYHVNALSQQAGLIALENKANVFKNINLIKQTRSSIKIELENIGFKVYDSQGNFIWVKSPYENLGKALDEKGILIRDYSSYKTDYYRITIKQKTDMDIFIKTVKEIINETK